MLELFEEDIVLFMVLCWSVVVLLWLSLMH